MRLPFPLLAAVVLSWPGTSDPGADIKCRYSSRSTCTPNGCGQNKPGSDYLLVPSIADLRAAMATDAVVEYGRCNVRRCTGVFAVAKKSGTFITLVVPGDGVILKIATAELMGSKPGDFVEVSTMMLSSFIGYGHCQQA